MQREEEYLRELGWSEEQVKRISSYVPDPVTEGARSKWHVELADKS